MSDYFKEAQKLTETGQSFVVVTLLTAVGSVPQDPGAKMIITAKGLSFGTVGGGKVEAAAQQYAKHLLLQKTEAPKLQKWNLQKDLGMSCGGEAQLLFELHQPSTLKIAIFGAGHIAQALVRILLTLDCQIQLFDPRPEWLQKLPVSGKLKLHQENFDLQKLDSSFYFLVMTQGHATDFPILRNVLKEFSDFQYVGVIGSKLKAMKTKNELIATGLLPTQVQQLHCPMGLSFGGNKPAEIAISIVAQVLQHRDLSKANIKIKDSVLPSIPLQI